MPHNRSCTIVGVRAAMTHLVFGAAAVGAVGCPAKSPPPDPPAPQSSAETTPARPTPPQPGAETGATPGKQRPRPPQPNVGTSCGDTTCVPPKQCVRFPQRVDDKMTTGHACEIPCDPVRGHEDCPAEQRCIPLPDGPGNVCR